MISELNSDVYFNTLAGALDAVEHFAFNAKAELDQNWRARFDFNYCIYSGCTARETIEIISLRGKCTNKALHLSLYRMDSGRYELTSYIL